MSGLVVDTSSSNGSLGRQNQNQRVMPASTGLRALMFAQATPKRHPLFQTPVFVPLVYYYVDFIVEGVMIFLSCYMVTGTAQKIMGVGSAVHAVLIFFTDYQASEPKVTLFHSPLLNMVIMNVFDWVTILAMAILPWIVDGFDAVLPKYFYTILAVTMAPLLIFMDPAPSFREGTNADVTENQGLRRQSLGSLSISSREDSSRENVTMDNKVQLQARRRSSTRTDDTPACASPSPSPRSSIQSSVRQSLRINESILKALLEEDDLLDEMSERTDIFEETSVSSDDPAHLVPQKAQDIEPRQKENKNYRDSIVHAFVGLHLLVWLCIVLGNEDYHQNGANSVWLYSVLVGSIAITIGLSRLSPTVATRGERLMLSILCVNVWVLATIAMLFIASPCVNCAHFFTTTKGPAAVAGPAYASSELEYSLFTTEYNTGWRFWHLILQEEDEVNSFGKDDFATMTCRRCISDAATLLTGEGWYKAFANWGRPDDDGTNVVASAGQKDWSVIEELPVEDHPIHQDAGELAAWYLDYANQTRTRDLGLFNDIVVEALASKGHLSGEALAGALEEFFCSPASRVDQPDPTTFLADIQKARFSGEDAIGTMPNLTSATLQKIMRGDYLRELGVRYVSNCDEMVYRQNVDLICCCFLFNFVVNMHSVCFVLRFSLLLEEDPTLENKPLSHTSLIPNMNEDELLVHAANYEIPGLVLPKIDLDIDPDGSRTKLLKNMMDLFIQLPYENPSMYFETKAEYLAFFRWELEQAVQDDWYFPKWLMNTAKKADIIELRSMKETHSPDHLVIEDTTSDLTMSDRSFYGTGQKFLTPIKIPGFDEDHDFQFPLTALSLPSNDHRDAFRYTRKPSEKELLRMVKAAYPKIIKADTMIREWKDKILQIDFSVLQTLEGRPEFAVPGSILYLDASTRMPMGIWMTTTRKMYLPSEGRDWEHAKFHHRVGERAMLTGHHVGESHFAYGNSLSIATQQTLEPDHPIRVLVKPFTLNANSVNSAAYNMLVRDHSILAHGAGLTQKGITTVFNAVYPSLNYSQTVPEMLASYNLERAIDTSDMPLHNQGLRLYEAHRTFVDRFVSLTYSSDEAMLADTSIVRFWHHVNTQGRHADPCICGMPSDIFFEDDFKWPAFENTHTCAQLLDHVDFIPEKNMLTRRQRWCQGGGVSAVQRLEALYGLLQKECAAKKSGCNMMYSMHTLRNDMGLPELKTRRQLVNFLATTIWHVTAGHEFTAENISYFADPFYSGVRLRESDSDGNLPLKVDVGTYVWGGSIASLTTIRGPPLLADWSPLYSYYASRRQDLSTDDRRALLVSLTDIHQDYKFTLVDLSKEFLIESISRRPNQRSNVFVPAVHTSSVSV